MRNPLYDTKKITLPEYIEMNDARVRAAEQKARSAGVFAYFALAVAAVAIISIMIIA